MRKIFFIAVLSIFTFLSFTNASNLPDEGMWLPMFISRLNYTDMQKMGLKLTAQEIYDVNNSSLKDAIVIFGRGCTGEMISEEGLLLTNHHCGYGTIQSLSTVNNDYLRDGFWAKSKEMELPCPALTVKYLVRMEDVTNTILSALTPEMLEPERNNKIRQIADSLSKLAVKDTWYVADVRPFFDGNEFYLFVYEEFKDIRFVGAPPSSIGKFGADTDNWMWPRHTGDFSMFRVYMSKDGKPAEYNKDNVPYKPKKSLTVSLKGLKQNDFVMIMGYPGTTQRYLTSWGVDLTQNQSDPFAVKIRTKKLDIMKEDMESSPEINLKYASKYAGSANYWKKFQGEIRGLKRLGVMDKKKAIETDFKNWLGTNSKLLIKYGNVLDDIGEAYGVIKKYNTENTYYREAILSGPEVVLLAFRFEGLYTLLGKEPLEQDKIDKSAGALKKMLVNYFKDYNLPTDQKLLTAMLKMFAEDVPLEQQPPIYATIQGKYKGDYAKYVAYIFSKSIFTDRTKLEAFLAAPSAKILDKDPIYQLMKSFVDNHRKYAMLMQPSIDKLAQANRLFVAGLREMYQDKKFYPNANSTMRLTYGVVKDYFPSDAVYYNYYTTLDGIMEKEDPTNEEFVVPAKLKELYKAKDYGRYGENGVMKVAFISNNDITGGNSGSPVLDGSGNLVGLAFDGNWEAMSGDIAFEPDLQRTINVDIRYVLFIIDKFAGATNLISEMKIVE